jgi:hypothetical protein
MNKDIAFCILKHIYILQDLNNCRLSCQAFYKASKNLSLSGNVSRITYAINRRLSYPCYPDWYDEYPDFKSALKDFLKERGFYDEVYDNYICKKITINGYENEILLHPLKETNNRETSTYLYYGLKKLLPNIQLRKFKTEQCNYCISIQDKAPYEERVVNCYLEDLSDMKRYDICNIYADSVMKQALIECFHNTQNLIIKNRNGNPIIKNMV